MQWTDEQKKAIEIANFNIVVSAAAGAGKTAVLVERVIQKILKNGRDIDRMLIVTFTKAAANEMRERIFDALAKELAENPKNSHIRRQIDLLPRANISTIHAFCQAILRNNFYHIGVSPDFEIADENKLSILSNDAVDDVFKKEYMGNNAAFHELVQNFGGKRGDDDLAELVRKLHDFSQAATNPREWLTGLSVSAEIFADEIARQFCLDLEGICAEYESAIRISRATDGLERYAEHMQGEMEFFRELARKCEGASWDTIRKHAYIAKFSNMPPKSKTADDGAANQVKEMRNNIKDLFLKYVKGVFYADLAKMEEDMQAMRPQLDALTGVVVKYNEEFMKRKTEENLLDFGDIIHMTAGLLEHNSEEIAKDFDEIYIDEFQDTNAAQARIFEQLGAYVKTFIVGDVKQSIYRFQNSEPRLFLAKMENAREADKVLHLAHNFRSNSGIIDVINHIFSAIMSRDVGEVDYDERHALIDGNADKMAHDMAENAVEIHIVESADNKEEQERLTDLEYEARLVAERILQLVEDEKAVNYGDIAILSRKRPGVSRVFADELTRQGIPTICEDNSGFFVAKEIEMMLNFLKIVDNQLQDIPLIAVLRSSIFNFTDDELAEMRLKTPKGAFYDAVKNFPGEKSERFITYLEKLVNMTKRVGPAEILEQIFYMTHFEAIVSTLPNPATRMANLQLLRKYAADFERAEHKSLHDFISFVNACIKNEKDFGVYKANAESENAVRIMTIHKSKGLEFKAVFVVGSGGRFNMRDIAKPLLYDFRRGIAMDFFDTKRRIKRPTIAKIAVSNAKRADMLSEEMRILYVALTRAIERLIVVGTVRDAERSLEKWRNAAGFSVAKQNTFIDWIGIGLAKNPPASVRFSTWSQKDLPIVPIKQRRIPETVIEGESLFDAEIAERFRFRLPEISSRPLPVKASVSQILTWNKPPSDDEKAKIIRETSAFSDDMPQASLMFRGTVVHFVIQNLDLSRVGSLAEIELQIGEMVKKNMLRASDAELVYANRILGFFQSELGKRLKESYKKSPFNVCREVKFFTEVRAADLLADADGDDKLLLQGVVDCYFFEDSGLVIIDFKTGKNAELKPQSVQQVKIYSLAMEKILKKKVKECYVYGGL
ncbi:MAG: helicase-exonuclease AddAB subunit AddA [Clostridiales bacterium]|jgi:ATP-dependent helicase/nuclease subunit A|nr:helicase-exonuclease AddAB subunit AddA [Clostridiales bacterium]